MKENGVPPKLARSSQQSMGTLLSIFGIASLSVLFAASIVLFIVLDNRNPGPRPDVAGFSLGLFLSTILIVLSSISLYIALLGAKRDRQGQIYAGMIVTLLLGLAFLGNQIFNWNQLHVAGYGFQGSMSGGFYFLTALHAAHVLGGLIPMATVTLAAGRGAYTRTSHHGLTLLGIYWHFLAAVWLILLVFLLSR